MKISLFHVNMPIDSIIFFLVLFMQSFLGDNVSQKISLYSDSHNLSGPLPKMFPECSSCDLDVFLRPEFSMVC